MTNEYGYGFADGMDARAQELKRMEAQLDAVTAERDALKKFAPNWDDAPEYARFVAMQADGTWRWYAAKPSMLPGFWESSFAICPVWFGEWANSLQERPVTEVTP